MAYGYAKSTGPVGAYTCVPGPGVLNTSAALCTAYGANAPVLCVTGEIPSDEIGRGHGILHELPDQLATLRDADQMVRAHRSSDARRRASSARRSSAAERPPGAGRDRSALGRVRRRRRRSRRCRRPTADSAARARSGARRARPPRSSPPRKQPMIMLGSGAMAARAEVAELARLLQAPVTSHRSGRGIIGEDTPYGLNFAAAYEPWLRCDVLRRHRHADGAAVSALAQDSRRA